MDALKLLNEIVFNYTFLKMFESEIWCNTKFTSNITFHTYLFQFPMLHKQLCNPAVTVVQIGQPSWKKTATITCLVRNIQKFTLFRLLHFVSIFSLSSFNEQPHYAIALCTYSYRK